MLWAAIAYAIAGSLFTNKVGHPLVSINYQMQRVEADFRFGLIRVRENAEQIAFYDGMRTEGSNAEDLFRKIRENWWRFMRYTRRYSYVVNFSAQVAEIFPIVVASPGYFAGALTFGTPMQIARRVACDGQSSTRIQACHAATSADGIRVAGHRAWWHQPALCRREPARHA
jgi:putative ATP-binding cassette transporter